MAIFIAYCKPNLRNLENVNYNAENKITQMIRIVQIYLRCATV